MRETLIKGLLPLVLVALSASCFEDRMTYGEALEAVAEAAVSAKGESMTQEIIEVSTDFTLGAAVAEAAEELRGWLESQIPCSTVSLDGTTVTVDFGDLADSCTYNGHTYAGLWAITIQRNDEDDVLVDHEWTALSNGDTTLDGTAQVTWGVDEPTRHVVHAVSWTDAQRTVTASGNRFQQLLDESAGLAGGIVVDGDRDWSGENGDWQLDIDQVEMRGQDPVPQAGTYDLTTPDGKSVTLSFERVDEETIRCVLTAGNRSWTFDVTRSGEIAE
jgi:hypothetical protein